MGVSIKESCGMLGCQVSLDYLHGKDPSLALKDIYHRNDIVMTFPYPSSFI